MTEPAGDPERHLPLKAVHHLLLLLLAEEPTYGVDLLERMEERSEGRVRLNAGSLYRTIAHLSDEGLIEPAEEVVPPGGRGAPRKIYRPTKLGIGVLRAETRRQAALVEAARSLDLAEGAEP